jgi:hypothetical protein
MAKSDTESWVRLAVGAILNGCLWPLMQGMAKWSSYDRELRLALLGTALAATALVAVVPLFWRGRPWQVAIAFVLLWLPALVLWGAVSSAIGNS